VINLFSDKFYILYKISLLSCYLLMVLLVRLVVRLLGLR
jgi:hypothetical protein